MNKTRQVMNELKTVNHEYDNIFNKRRDYYYMDVENYALSRWTDKIIKGPMRLYNKKWMKHIKLFLDQCCDDYEERYIYWVLNGGGDEWFIDYD